MSDENKNIENNQEENQNREECNKKWWKNVGLKPNLRTLNRIKIPIKNSILHSDRGALYSSFQYIQKTKELNITRSMSEPARPTQNAPIESFFGHLKDEIDYKKCKSFDELNDLVDNYIYYYNTRRYQWNRKKMAPVIYRNFLLSYQNSPI